MAQQLAIHAAVLLLEQAYNFAKDRRENTDSVIPSLVEGQAPQIIFSVKLAGEDAQATR